MVRRGPAFCDKTGRPVSFCFTNPLKPGRDFTFQRLVNFAPWSGSQEFECINQ